MNIKIAQVIYNELRDIFCELREIKRITDFGLNPFSIHKSSVMTKSAHEIAKGPWSIALAIIKWVETVPRVGIAMIPAKFAIIIELIINYRHINY